MTSSFELAVIVPIYNEDDILWKNIEAFSEKLDETIGSSKWQYILVDNGSTDKTPEIIHKIIDRWRGSLSVNLDKPNYGKALRVGLDACEGPWAHIINVEQWDPLFLEWSWKMREHYDLILGSKRADPTINFQSPYRRILSWGLNSVLQLFFEFTGVDSHGLKLLKMKTMRPILRQTVMNRGQFDTEFTLRTIRAGLWIAEVPVVYEEQRPPRNWMVSKIAWNVRDLLRLRRMIRRIPYAGCLKFHRWSRHDLLGHPSPVDPQFLSDADAADEKNKSRKKGRR